MRKDQKEMMGWILFWVFVGFFVLIVAGTLIAVFLGGGKLQGNERTTLFTAFLVEIGAAVVALFYSVFGLKTRADAQSKVRLTVAAGGDVQQLLHKTAMLSLSDAEGSAITSDVPRRIIDDQGPCIPLQLPPGAHYVHLTVKVNGSSYQGSFFVGTHLVDLIKSED